MWSKSPSFGIVVGSVTIQLVENCSKPVHKTAQRPLQNHPCARQTLASGGGGGVMLLGKKVFNIEMAHFSIASFTIVTAFKKTISRNSIDQQLKISTGEQRSRMHGSVKELKAC